MVIFNPLDFSNLPNEAAVIPFPRPDTTPPKTNTYFVAILLYFKTGANLQEFSVSQRIPLDFFATDFVEKNFFHFFFEKGVAISKKLYFCGSIHFQNYNKKINRRNAIE